MLLERLFTENPYKNFQLQDLALNHEVMFHLAAGALNLVAEIKPKRIIEVGTWQGNSAFYMASKLLELGEPFEMVCVDTWLGSHEAWIKENGHRKHWDKGLKRRNGYPTVYYQFLANVIHKGLQDYIVPFPATSDIAAKVLQELDYTAQFIYIDASHDEHDVFRDLINYWKLLEPGGIMCGDDYQLFEGVVTAVHNFVMATGCSLDTTRKYSNAWVIRKP